jgi:GNAT superfamily N-acetyltransferase
MVNTRFALSLASAAEAPQLSTLMRETFMAAYGDIAPTATLDCYQNRVYAPASLAERIERHAIEVWVLRAIDAEPGLPDAGYVQIGTQLGTVPVTGASHALEVQRFYLRPEYIGSGGGDLLMEKAQQRARELNAQRLHLSVYQIRPRAIRFYQRHGFRIVAPVQFFLDEVPFDDWLMVCELG